MRHTAAFSCALPDLLIVLSAVFWRNGFKYGDFADHPTQALLGLDPTREGPLAILTLTTTQNSPPPAHHHPHFADLIATPVNEAGNPPPSVTELLPHLTAVHTAAAHCPPAYRNRTSQHLPHRCGTTSGQCACHTAAVLA
ncbi:MAG: hypothetical protein ACRDQZ_15470, partial [Mycobacteriales bacterium]